MSKKSQLYQSLDRNAALCVAHWPARMTNCRDPIALFGQTRVTSQRAIELGVLCLYLQVITEMVKDFQVQVAHEFPVASRRGKTNNQNEKISR